MIAPSERHLEDWIVANSETFSEQVRFAYWRRLIDRQFKLSTGIVDLLIAAKLGLRVIELKKGLVDGNAVSQVIRYVGELSYLFEYAKYKFPEYEPPCETNERHISEDAFPLVSGILIGHSFDEMALRACLTNQITAYTYDYTDGGYVFEEVCADADIDLRRIFNSDLGMAMKEVFRHRRLYVEDVETLKTIFREEGSL